MITTTYWTLLQTYHHELNSRFIELRKVRADRAAGNSNADAEMKYFQALQQLYTTAQNAVNHVQNRIEK